MNFMRVVKAIIVDRRFPFAIGLLGLVIILATPERLSDLTNEIQYVGSTWFRGTAIPLVDVYSNFGPFVLYLGSWYERLVTTSFIAHALDAVYYISISWVFYAWLRQIHPKDTAYRNMLALFGVIILAVPGVWQIGITPLKISLLCVIGLNYCFHAWQASTKSYWVFGETSKNWRYMLACGVLLSVLLYTSLLFSLFAIPWLIQYIRSLRRESLTTRNHTPLLIVPILLHSWVWYSYFSSRHLLGEAIRTSGLDFTLTTHGISLTSLQKIGLILPLFTLLILALICVRSDNFKKDHRTWILGLGVLEGLIVSRSGILYTLPLLLILFAPAYIKKISTEFLVLWFVVMLVFIIPYRALDVTKANSEFIKAKLANTFVSQRNVTEQNILYYGRGARFYSLSGFAPSTRFPNTQILFHDTKNLTLADKFRGDNEAVAPTFVVYALEKDLQVGNIPRLEEYFTKHYDKYAEIEGYTILKRKSVGD